MAIALDPNATCLPPLNTQGSPFTTQLTNACGITGHAQECGVTIACSGVDWVKELRPPSKCDPVTPTATADCSKVNALLCGVANRFTGELDKSNAITGLALNYLLTERYDENCSREFNGGWWADSVRPNGFNLGSRLWTLQGSLATNQILLLAKQYAEEALSPLLSQGIANEISVATSYVKKGVISLLITIMGQGNKTNIELFGNTNNQFGYLWKTQL